MTAKVGNDVVDLKEPRILRHHANPRFLARVLTEEERASVLCGEDKHWRVWSLFAAKEAAYKVAVKLGHAPGFAHRAFSVAPDQSSVTYKAERYALRVTGDDDHVHAIAWLGDPPEGSVVTVTEEARARGEVRAAATAEIAGALGVDVGEVAIVRDSIEGSWDGFGPPRVTLRGEPLAIDISLSHDGRFAAFAWTAPRPSRRG